MFMAHKFPTTATALPWQIVPMEVANLVQEIRMHKALIGAGVTSMPSLVRMDRVATPVLDSVPEIVPPTIRNNAGIMEVAAIVDSITTTPTATNNHASRFIHSLISQGEPSLIPTIHIRDQAISSGKGTEFQYLNCN